LATLLLTISQAQTVRAPLSATSPFLNAYSLKETNAFSTFTNPAALASIPTLSGGVYGERRFLLQELSFYQAALSVPTPSGHFGFTGSYIGQSTCYEGGVGLAYGRRLGSKVDVGARFNFHTLKIAGYGTASAAYVEAGALLHLDEQVHIGAKITNPTVASLGKEGEDLLPVMATIGVGYEVSPQFFIAGEVQQLFHDNLSVNTGMKYRFGEQMWAQAGFRSATTAYYLGLGFCFKAMQLETIASVHPQLGVTPGLLLLFTRKEEKP
jgi:hypothetical protein